MRLDPDNNKRSAISSLDISDSEKDALDELVGFIKKEWPLANCKLFGSKLRGTADDESDMDILITLPCSATDEIRRRIVHEVFNINLSYGSNISALVVSDEEWDNSAISVLPVHAFIEEEGLSL